METKKIQIQIIKQTLQIKNKKISKINYKNITKEAKQCIEFYKRRLIKVKKFIANR